MPRRREPEDAEVEMLPPTAGRKPDGSDFAFIPLSHPDDAQNRSVRTKIRRHVMRDIGRSRRPRTVTIPIEVPLDQGGLRQLRHASIEAVDTVGIDGLDQEVPLRQPPMSGESFGLLGPAQSLQPLGDFPVEPDRRALELVHFSTPVFASYHFKAQTKFDSSDRRARGHLPAFPLSMADVGDRRSQCLSPLTRVCRLIHGAETTSTQQKLQRQP